jgi:hypothetical protein
MTTFPPQQPLLRLVAWRHPAGSSALRWSGHHRFVDVVILQEIATDPHNSLEPLIDLLNDADTPLTGLSQPLW